MKPIATHKQRVFGLDVVRATAILIVLCSHSTILLFPESNNVLIKTIKFFGITSVDVFFILSGFLIGTILIKHIEKRETSVKDFGYFWTRRWFRTLPNYFLILLINIGLFYAFNNQLPDRIGSYFLFLQNFNQAQPDFFTESWSLSIEEFAYLLGPTILLIMGFIFKKINKQSFLIMIVIIILLSILSRLIFHFNIATENLSWSKSLRKVVIYRIDSIYYGFIGAYFAYYYKALWLKYKWASLILGVTLFLIVHSFIFINKSEPNTGSLFYNVFYLSLLFISILFLFPFFSSWNTGKIFTKIITKVSIWSYAIYLINYSIVLLTIREFVVVSELNGVQKVLLLLLFWFITFLLSIALYNLYEKPFTQLRDSKRIKRYFASKQ